MVKEKGDKSWKLSKHVHSGEAGKIGQSGAVKQKQPAKPLAPTCFLVLLRETDYRRGSWITPPKNETQFVQSATVRQLMK
jgi:hypothetical protein